MTQPTSAAQKVAYDFSDLTPTQQNLLTFQGWHALDKYTRQPSAATVKKLISRGLLFKEDREIHGVIVTEYDVPISVHIAWCEFCARATATSEDV